MSALARALRQVGLANLPARQSAVLARLFALNGRSSSSESNPTAGEIFSKREREVHERLCLGLPSKIIARQLKVSEVTVRFHLTRIYKKLGVNRRSLAIAVSRQRGLFPSS
jgi:DNA-binding NarL/FixJ family response regulator